jgi:hypothetical protein
LVKRQRDIDGYRDIDRISAAQLHSSLNGGSLPHGGMDEPAPPAPALDGDRPLDPDPLLDVDTPLDP